MKPIISQLFSEGDFHLKEARANFLVNDENQSDAMCSTCNALKKYLDAYEVFLFENVKPTQNYHVTMHVIAQKDPGFTEFSERIYEVKCFVDESKEDPEGFFLYADEVNDVLKNLMDIRNYIASKINLKEPFLVEFAETSFMTT